MDRSDIGMRMKEYEVRNRYYLQKKLPVIIRVDMRSGHTFTKGFKRPFDHIFMETMQETMKYMCENISGTKCAYVQSDEISLFLSDYDKLETQPFFEYRVDKMCSISASMATMIFNMIFRKNAEEYINNTMEYWNISTEEKKYINALEKAIEKGAMFDSRVFNIPKEEVTNYFYWRQLDATRNSIQMVGQANFSHKQLHKKNCNDIQDMLHEEKGINWNDFPTTQKRGSCCIKGEHGWDIDNEIPIFKGEGRDYIEKLVWIGE